MYLNFFNKLHFCCPFHFFLISFITAWLLAECRSRDNDHSDYHHHHDDHQKVILKAKLFLISWSVWQGAPSSDACRFSQELLSLQRSRLSAQTRATCNGNCKNNSSYSGCEHVQLSINIRSPFNGVRKKCFFFSPRVVRQLIIETSRQKNNRGTAPLKLKFFQIKLAHLSSSFSSGMTSIVMLTTTW